MNPALATVKMPGKVGIERIRQMMKEEKHPDFEKILVILVEIFVNTCTFSRESSKKNLKRKNYAMKRQILLPKSK